MTLLKLDYDNITVKDVQLIWHHRGWLLKYFTINWMVCFETTNGYHVKVDIYEYLSDYDIFVMEMLMGSDINRTIYNFLRKFDGQLKDDYDRLYTKKYLILSTAPKSFKEIGNESLCPELQERLEHELEESKNWKAKI